MIQINHIPQHKHRYPKASIGDYFKDKKGNTIINVTDFGDERVNAAIAIHELFEELATRWVGIDEPEIMKFDLAFEEERSLGLHEKNDEPGDDKRSPYFEQHQKATNIERLVVESFGLTWEEYEEIIQR